MSSLDHGDGGSAGAGRPAPAVLDLRRQVEDYLGRLVFDTEPLARPLAAAMRYSLLAGGERLRPLIALATAELLGRPAASMLPLAAALEMIDIHSLVHDDLPAMNDDDVRDGRPSAHVAFGEDVALLAGDALLAEAIALVLREQEGEPARVLATVAELTLAVVEGSASRHLGAPVLTVLALTGASGPVATALRQFAAQLAGGSQTLALAALAEVPGDRVALQRVAELALQSGP